MCLLAIARGELPTLLKWSDEAESSENDLVVEAKRIAAEDDAESTKPDAPSAEAAHAGVALPDGDDDWMKLGDDARDSDGQRRKKKSNKKKK